LQDPPKFTQNWDFLVWKYTHRLANLKWWAALLQMTKKWI
jgi:hypothetical protein